MQIGEFAKVCGTKISVLRHYDKEGLLIPEYVDTFTGYRYYNDKQLRDFLQIQRLKEAGFTLAEIRCLLKLQDEKQFAQWLEEKEQKLMAQLNHLKGLKSMMKTEKAILKELHENIDLPFVEDDVSGKWEIIGEFDNREEYEAHGSEALAHDEWGKEIYFLPNGQFYWCFGWTKGKLLINTGVESYCNDYHKEEKDGQRYLFVDLKSHQYRLNGKTTVLVLRQVDKKSYTASEIARKDELNLPFVMDKKVLGTWQAHSFCRRKEDFDPKRPTTEHPLYFSSVEFLENGLCRSIYSGEEIFGEEKQTWTKGHLLRKMNHCDCAYEIRRIDGVDYLIMEWKSGDYRWGGFDTDYYVFVRV